MSAEETVARVLGEHCDDMESGDYGDVLWSGCTCGHRHPFDQHHTHVAAEIVRALGLVEETVRLRDYLDTMDRAGGGIYTQDFRDGFRHALRMLEAYRADRRNGGVSPEVREAAREALMRREASDVDA